MGKLVFQATLGGQVNLVGPNTASTYDINVPAVAGNMVTTGDTGTVTNTMLAGSIANSKLTNSSVTIGSTSVALGATSTTLDGVNIGATTAGTGAFTTLSASSTVSGTGFSTYLASPPAIGGTAAAAVSSTALSYTTTLTGGTGVVNLGSGQFYKDASGNVGIGTSSPSYKLDVNGSIRGDTFVRATSGSVGSYLVANSGGGFGIVGTATNHPLLLNTNDTERARIDTSGTFIVGGTNQSNGAKIQSVFNGSTLNGFVSYDSAGASGTTFFMCSLNGTNIGTIARVGATSAVVYNTTSDQRLKSNIEDAAPVLDKLMAVTVRQYDWTEGNLHQDYGFIAQELEPVLSGVVTKGKTEEDIWQLDYSRLTPHLVKAIQEQQAIITQLQADVAALKASQ